MQILDTIDTTRKTVSEWRQAGLAIALVPTMGALHAGHLSLVDQALAQADRVIVSLFVNPLQFGPSEDFDRYPRTFAQDRELLLGRGVHGLFCPNDTEMYPGGRQDQTRVHVPQLSEMLCGTSRPGFFDGVATVVTKLFNAVQPDVAIFGQKDYQQLLVIQRLVEDLNLPIQILSGPIVREADGLALSSRNAYLSPADRAIAPGLQEELRRAARALQAGVGAVDVERQAITGLQAAGFRPDYVSVRRAADLREPAVGDDSLVVLAAAYLGGTRLIDNLRVERSTRA